MLIVVLFLNNKPAYENAFFPHASAIFRSVPSRYAPKNKPSLKKKFNFQILDPNLGLRLVIRLLKYI